MTWTGSYTFKLSPAPAIQAPSNYKITNIIPSDFDYDGRLDLLVMSQANPNGGWWSDDQLLHLHFYRGLGESTFDEPKELPSSSPVQPMVLDTNGDMKADLLGMSTDKDSRMKLWKNILSAERNDTLFEM